MGRARVVATVISQQGAEGVVYACPLKHGRNPVMS